LPRSIGDSSSGLLIVAVLEKSVLLDMEILNPFVADQFPGNFLKLFFPTSFARSNSYILLILTDRTNSYSGTRRFLVSVTASGPSTPGRKLTPTLIFTVPRQEEY
jgi:hypothetical protein